MTDPAELNLTDPWTDETPLDQIPEEHRERVSTARAEAAKAAEATANVDTVAAAATRTGSRASTKARVTSPRPKAGARRRNKPETDPAPDTDADRVAVVLKTSRYTGRQGRAIARKTTVLVTVDRGLQLIMLDHAREATEAESKAAAVAPIYLD